MWDEHSLRRELEQEFRLVDTANPVDAEGNPVDLTPIEIGDTDEDENEEDTDDDGGAATGEAPDVTAETEE